jgi:hypothetical protein
MIKTNPDITIIDLREGKDNCDIGFDCISIPYYEINNRISFVLGKREWYFIAKTEYRANTLLITFRQYIRRKIFII